MSYFPELNIEDWIFHGFEDFEEFDLLYLLKNLKATKLTPAEVRMGMKPKQANIRFKDYMVNIESLKFSQDGTKLLVCYKTKGSNNKSEDNEYKPKGEPTGRTKGPTQCKIKEWDILKGEVINQYEHDYRVSHAMYYPGEESTIIASGSLPYIFRNFGSEECIINAQKYEEQVERIYEKDEKWIIKPLENRKKPTFVVFNKDYNILAVIEASDECNLPRDNSKTKEEGISLHNDKYTVTHDEVRAIIESKEQLDSEQDMDVDLHEDVFHTFQKFFIGRPYNIIAYSCINSEVTSLDIFQPNSLIITNCFDKVLRLFDASEETLKMLSEEGTQKMNPFREFTDIVLKRKFAGGMFYKVPEDMDLYLLTGIEKAGELIAYSVKLGSQYARVGNWKEGCEYMTYFNNDMKNFMIVYITSMSSVVVWKKPIFKNFQALSPNFTHIEQNETYVPPEGMVSEFEKEYVEPKSDVKLSSCFKARNLPKDIKNIPARLHLNDNITEFCRNKIILSEFAHNFTSG